MNHYILWTVYGKLPTSLTIIKDKVRFAQFHPVPRVGISIKTESQRNMDHYGSTKAYDTVLNTPDAPCMGYYLPTFGQFLG